MWKNIVIMSSYEYNLAFPFLNFGECGVPSTRVLSVRQATSNAVSV